MSPMSWVPFETLFRFLLAALALKAATFRVRLRAPQEKPKCHLEGETTRHFLPRCTRVLWPRWCCETQPPLGQMFRR